MRRWFLIVGFLLNLSFTTSAPPAKITVASNEAVVEFPDRLTFNLKATSDTDLSQVILEYGLSNQLTCGQVIAKAFPQNVSGRDLDLTWTWEMRDSGSQPPGAMVWWRWRILDSAGNATLTDQKTVTWLDQTHHWTAIQGQNINLHWYRGSQAFGQDLHTAAVDSLRTLQSETGLKPDAPIDLYIYGSNNDLKDAVLYEPGWTGGLAYPEYNITIIGIPPDQTDWGKRAQAHELTHVLVGHLTFSCLGIVPTWLDEGLAVYGEGGPDEAGRQQLQDAINSNTLLPVQSLSGGFSEDPGQANLAYSQSYSLVNFLIKTYGRDKIIALLTALHNSATVDAALQQTYGFDIAGFEAAWRADVGAAPRSAPAQTQATALPTLVPTFVLISASTAIPVTIQPSPTSTPVVASTPTSLAATKPEPPGRSLQWSWLALGALACCGFGVVGLGLASIAISRLRRGA